MKYHQHPLSQVFPGMSDEEFAALIEDIRVNGQKDAAIIYDGMILDGFHRHAACISLGIELRLMELPPDRDPVAFVISKNIHRRHLSPSQIATAVVACHDWVKSGENQHPETGAAITSAPTVEARLTTHEMALEAGVSDRTIRDAKAAFRKGHGEAVTSGEMSVSKAANLDKPKKPTALEKAKVEISELSARIIELESSIHDLTDDMQNQLDAKRPEAEQKIKFDQLRREIRTLECQRNEQMLLVDTWKHECRELRKRLGI